MKYEFIPTENDQYLMVDPDEVESRIAVFRDHEKTINDLLFELERLEIEVNSLEDLRSINIPDEVKRITESRILVPTGFDEEKYLSMVKYPDTTIAESLQSRLPYTYDEFIFKSGIAKLNVKRSVIEKELGKVISKNQKVKIEKLYKVCDILNKFRDENRNLYADNLLNLRPGEGISEYEPRIDIVLKFNK